MMNINDFHRISELQAPAFLLCFIVISMAESFIPLRQVSQGPKHFFYNVGLTLLNFMILGGFSFCMVEYSVKALAHGWGLWNNLGWHHVGLIAVQVLLYDLLNYFVHRSFHTVDFLWSYHRIHHSDTAMDATTTFRFHPAEGIYRLICQGAFIAITGMHPFAIISYSLIAIPIFLTSHANLNLPRSVEKFLGAWIVLPRDHSIHHHPNRALHDSNYGTAFMIWDHLFGTYKSPYIRPAVMPVGLTGYPKNEPSTIGQMLSDPWVKR